MGQTLPIQPPDCTYISPPLTGQNCPNPHERDVPQWLDAVAPSTAPWVALAPGVGPRLPAVAPPCASAPSPGQRAYSALRMTFGGAALGVPDDWQPKRRPVVPELADAIAAAPKLLRVKERGHKLLRGRHGVKHPGREPAAALMAAYAARIEGRSSGWVHRHTLGLTGAVELAADDKERSRAAERIIRRGDWLWRALGAWPWAAFPADWAPPLTWEWWTDERPAHALAAWRADALEHLERRARALEHEARQARDEARLRAR